MKRYLGKKNLKRALYSIPSLELFISDYTKKTTFLLGNNIMEHTLYIVLLLIAFVYVYMAYRYLTNLKSCSCAEGEYVENVKKAERLLMIMILIWILMSIWLTSNIKTLSKKDTFVFLFLTGAFGIVLFSIYLYFCINVTKLRKVLVPKCPCAMKWQRWLIYGQYGLFLLEILLVLISVIVGAFYMVTKKTR